MEEEIRKILAEYAKLPVDIDTVAPDADLYTLGLTSHASVNVMLGLEDALGIEFPDSALRKDTFRTIGNIADVLHELDVAAGA